MPPPEYPLEPSLHAKNDELNTVSVDDETLMPPPWERELDPEIKALQEEKDELEISAVESIIKIPPPLDHELLLVSAKHDENNVVDTVAVEEVRYMPPPVPGPPYAKQETNFTSSNPIVLPLT